MFPPVVTVSHCVSIPPRASSSCLHQTLAHDLVETREYSLSLPIFAVCYLSVMLLSRSLMPPLVSGGLTPSFPTQAPSERPGPYSLELVYWWPCTRLDSGGPHFGLWLALAAFVFCLSHAGAAYIIAGRYRGASHEAWIVFILGNKTMT